MTREIIESILLKEKTADDLLDKAQQQAKNISLQTDQQIAELQKKFKQEQRQRILAAKTALAEKTVKAAQKTTQKLDTQLAELEKIVHKNYSRTIKKFLTKLLD
jgi:hypothetical protein